MNIYKVAADLKNKNESFVIAFVVNAVGSSPGKTGFKIIVKDDGSSVGTVGGGAIEAEVIREARNCMHTGKNKLQEYSLSNKTPEETEDIKIIPMACNGRMTIFYEVHGKQPTVYVFGGGHVGSSIIYFLRPLNFFTVLVDNRTEFVSSVKNSVASDCVLCEYDEYTNKFDPPEDSCFVIVTHGHNYDEIILKNIYSKRKKYKYVGVIASKSKASSLAKSLKNEFGENIDLSNFHSPVGLKIGGSTAEEIALAIAAEIQSVHYQNNQK